MCESFQSKPNGEGFIYPSSRQFAWKHALGPGPMAPLPPAWKHPGNQGLDASS